MTRRCLLVAAMLAVPAAAPAHIMPEGQGSTRLVGNRAHTLVAIPVRAFKGFDDDGDGLLSRAELARHGRALEEQSRRLVRLTVDGRAGSVIYLTLLVEHADSSSAPMRSVTVMRIDEWAAPVERVTVRAELFGTRGGELTFRAIQSVQEPAEPGQPAKVRDLRAEEVVLAGRRKQHEFFR